MADGGGLAAAARATGVSVPTLGRRMTALEAAAGIKLFERGARGYRLTAEGRGFAEEARVLRHTHARLARMGAAQRAPVPVRVTAGVWTSRFLARTLPAVTGGPWVPEFVSSLALIDLARREADIGVRNKRPDQPWLAGRRTARITFAMYAAHEEVRPVALRPQGASSTPSERWVRSALPDAPQMLVNDPRLALDLTRAGHARMVLPCFVGEAEPHLIRQGDIIQDLTHEEWLVSHHEARHDPPVRAALQAIGAVLTDRNLRP